MENKPPFDIPVLFILFNRPDLAVQVLNRIRLIAPSYLYVAIDGPRLNFIHDIDNVNACKALIETIDWPCTIQTLYRNENLGCKKAVSSAVTWFFDQVETGIILEDDCLPDLTFFDFCRTMLQKYSNEPKVMHIGGANLYRNNKWGEHTYFFSSIAHIWGWATWRRAWQYYSVDMKGYLEFRQSNLIEQIVTHRPSIQYWKQIFDNTYAGTVDTWDYQWMYTIWKYQGISIIPNQNLISNIGFGEAATHTSDNSEFANLPTTPIKKEEINHPTEIKIDKQAVKYALVEYYSLPSRWDRLKSIFISR